MEEVDGEDAVFEVIAEDVGVVACSAVAMRCFSCSWCDGGELIARRAASFELLGFAGGCHRAREGALEFRLTAFEKELRVADGLL